MTNDADLVARAATIHGDGSAAVWLYGVLSGRYYGQALTPEQREKILDHLEHGENMEWEVAELRRAALLASPFAQCFPSPPDREPAPPVAERGETPAKERPPFRVEPHGCTAIPCPACHPGSAVPGATMSNGDIRCAAWEIRTAHGIDKSQQRSIEDTIRRNMRTPIEPSLLEMRERCAKACDALAVEFYNGDEAGGAMCCAEAIRALPLTPDAPSTP